MSLWTRARCMGASFSLHFFLFDTFMTKILATSRQNQGCSCSSLSAEPKVFLTFERYRICSTSPLCSSWTVWHRLTNTQNVVLQSRVNIALFQRWRYQRARNSYFLSSLQNLFFMTTLSKSKLFRTVNSNQMVSFDDASFFFFLFNWVFLLNPARIRLGSLRCCHGIIKNVFRDTKRYCFFYINSSWWLYNKETVSAQFPPRLTQSFILVYFPISFLPKNTILSLIFLLSSSSSSSSFFYIFYTNNFLNNTFYKHGWWWWMLQNCYRQYFAGSMFCGICWISVPNSCSILNKLKRSSYVTRFTAIPKWPNRPDLPTLCKYVSPDFGKSKLMTTFTDWMSIPRVNKSEETKFLHDPALKSWKTLFRSPCCIFAWM